MTPIEIAPALEPADWERQRYGSIALDDAGQTPRLIVTDPNGQVVRVSGGDELFALMALANEALPANDPRKLTRDIADAVCASCDELTAHAEIFLTLLRPVEEGKGDATVAEREALASFQRRCTLLGQAGLTLRALVRPMLVRPMDS